MVRIELTERLEGVEGINQVYSEEDGSRQSEQSKSPARYSKEVSVFGAQRVRGRVRFSLN